MTLAEFRRLTAHLAGERELLCAGAGINIVWHDETDYVSIDDGDVDVEDQGVVLWQAEDYPWRSCR